MGVLSFPACCVITSHWNANNYGNGKPFHWNVDNCYKLVPIFYKLSKVGECVYQKCSCNPTNNCVINIMVLNLHQSKTIAIPFDPEV